MEINLTADAFPFNTKWSNNEKWGGNSFCKTLNPKL